MASVHAPTILYPNGGEHLASPTISVRWESPQTQDADGRAVWYELFYTEQYEADGEPDWIAIATLPSTVNEFQWRVGRSMSSSRCRVGIRSRNSQGTRSIMSLSAADFSINRATLPVPKIVSPVVGGHYDGVCQIVVSADRLPDRSYYQFYYSSVSANIPMTSIGQKTLARDIPLVWVTADLPPANDYVLHAAVVASDGSVSDATTVRAITIGHEGYFIIDTLPPVSSVKIEGDELFTRERNISVSVYSYDEATDVHSMMLKDSEDSENSRAQQKSLRAAHTLSGEDGVKEVTAVVMDFGANRNTDILFNPPSFQNAAPVANSDIVDAYVSKGSDLTFVHLIAKGTEGNGLYEFTMTDEKVGFPRRVSEIEDTPTAVAAYLFEEYVATIDDQSEAYLLKYVTGGFTLAYKFPEGERVTDMEAHGGYLFIGTNKGSVYRYNGSDMLDITSNSAIVADGDLGISKWGKPSVRRIKSDGGKLFILFDNSATVGILTGDNLLYR